MSTDSRWQITCMWCGHTIKITETSSTHVWPPRHNLCCEESVRRWENDQKEENRSWLSKVISIFTGKRR